MDFFDTTAAADELDPSYVHIRDSEDCVNDRAYLEGLWREFRQAADPMFHQQMQLKNNFEGRVWEMRLAVVLKRIGLPVVLTRRNGGPDVLIEGSPRVWIEAVAPHTNEVLDDNDAQARRSVAPSPEEDVILRYTQSLQEKWSVYQRYLCSGLVRAEDAFVVAVSGANLHHPTSGGGPHWMAKPLFGLGNRVFQREVGTGRDLGGYWNFNVQRTTRRGSPVEADLFLSSKRSGLSAVLYSAHHVKNRPEVHGFMEGSDFRVFHNPFATVPLPVGFIARGEEWGVEDGNLRRFKDFTSALRTG